MAKPIRKYSEEETEAYRQRFLTDEVVPHVSKVFERHPEFRSAVMFVAQYWCDEAEDHMHCEFAYSVHDTPDVEGYMARHKENWDKLEGLYNNDEDAADELQEYIEDTAWLMEGADGARTIGVDLSHYQLNERYLSGWDESDKAIPNFAAFTEAGSQESGFHENFSPYALLKREGDKIVFEIVGKMLRPWLDGVPSQEEAYTDQHNNATASEQPEKRGFWARLFGKR